MFQGYRTIFWGIFFMSFHINLGPLSILPSFVGALILRNGIRGLTEISESSMLRSASHLSVVSAILFCIGNISDFGLLPFSAYSIVYIVLSAAGRLCELFLFYFLFNGSIEILQSFNEKDLVQEYVRKTRFFIIMFLVYSILFLIALTFSLKPYVTIAAILGLIIRVWLMASFTALKTVGPSEQSSSLPQ